MSTQAQESRVDALIRLVGFVVLAFGFGLIYITYSNVTALAGQAPLIPVYYALGVLLFVSGFLASFSKFK